MISNLVKLHSSWEESIESHLLVIEKKLWKVHVDDESSTSLTFTIKFQEEVSNLNTTLMSSWPSLHKLKLKAQPSLCTLFHTRKGEENREKKWKQIKNKTKTIFFHAKIWKQNFLKSKNKTRGKTNKWLLTTQANWL